LHSEISRLSKELARLRRLCGCDDDEGEQQQDEVDEEETLDEIEESQLTGVGEEERPAKKSSKKGKRKR